MLPCRCQVKIKIHFDQYMLISGSTQLSNFTLRHETRTRKRRAIVHSFVCSLACWFGVNVTIKQKGWKLLRGLYFAIGSTGHYHSRKIDSFLKSIKKRFNFKTTSSFGWFCFIDLRSNGKSIPVFIASPAAQQ